MEIGWFSGGSLQPGKLSASRTSSSDFTCYLAKMHITTGVSNCLRRNSGTTHPGPNILRSAKISGHELKLTGDINATTDFGLLFDPTEKAKFISFNGVSAQSGRGKEAGCPTLHVPFVAPNISLPDLTAAGRNFLRIALIAGRLLDAREVSRSRQ